MRPATTVALLCALGVARGIEVPGYALDPLPGAERNTWQSMMKIYEDVFDDEMLRQLDLEMEHFSDLAKSTSTLANNKRVTFWIGKKSKPRCALERAVKLLEKLTFPAEHGGSKAFGIVGCKYWVQRHGTGGNVNFHYDKDEGLASDKSIMKTPPYVGVTHMDNFGAPTLVFNQTTTNNGNQDVPTTPANAWLVYPKRNKHAIHRGDLAHGAPAILEATPVPAGAHRITFITSWETTKPLEPNCHELKKDFPAVLRKLPHTKGGGLSSKIHDVDPLEMDLPAAGENKETKRHEVKLFLGEVVVMDLLKTPERGATYHAVWGGKSKIYSNIYLLDLDDRSQMNMLFGKTSAVLLVFYDGETNRQKSQRMAMKVQAAVLAKQSLYAEPLISTFMAEATKCKDALKSFGITMEQVQRGAVAAIHYPKQDKKYNMEPQPLTRKSLGKFVARVLNEARRERGKSEL